MTTTSKWWQKAVIYQIYPRSFCDSDGDGIGDIPGIISKLDYVKALGVDAIWLSPVFKSPQDDNGYDISDYQDIDPMFGTLDDMRTLLKEANARGIKIIMDMVLNHTSDEHAWFLEAKKDRTNPKHDWYVWRDGEPGTPPNELRSCFGGSAWEWCEECGQYYLHQYSIKQPDLNWDNPDVRHALYDMMNWWVEQGAGGFRLDVIDSIAKEPDRMVTAEGTNLHKYVKEMSAAVLQGTDLVAVGEAWSANVERAKLWSNPDGSELSMVFQFEHIGLDQQEGKDKWDLAPLQLRRLKDVFGRWQTQLNGQGWNSLFWNNHDLPRIVSRWGNDREYRAESAKMLATMLHGMQGTPYIYQGEELGMTNIRLDISQYVDVESINLYKAYTAAGWSHDAVMEAIYARGRDNARTPMQWTAGENAGFTTGTPWLPVNENHNQVNAEAELADPDSVFHYYQKLIALRKEYDIFRDGWFELLDPESREVFAYTRDTETAHMLVVCNFTAQTLDWKLPWNYRGAKKLIGNYPDDFEILRPYEAYICYYEDIKE